MNRAANTLLTLGAILIALSLMVERAHWPGTLALIGTVLIVLAGVRSLLNE